MHAMQHGSRRPIRVFLAHLVVLGLLPVALLGAWAVVSTISAQRDETQRSALELSRALASAVESELDATVQTLAAISRSSTLQAGDMRAFYDVALDEVAAHPQWAAIVMTDASGRLLFNTLLPYGSTDGRIVDPTSLDRVIRSGKPTVGRLLTGRTRSAFPVRVPVFIDDRLAYVITAAVMPDRMVQVLKRQRQPRGWVISVFDDAHVRVARSLDQPGTVGAAAKPDLQALLERPDVDGVGITHTVEGEEVFTGFTRLAPYDWIVAVGAPTENIKKALWRSVGWYLTGILASIGACTFLAQRMSRRIDDGVRRMRDEAV